MLCNAYDSQLANITKPIVVDISKTKEGNIQNFSKANEAIAAKLFELYCELKKFSDYAMEIYGNPELKMNEYYSWFSYSFDKRNSDSVFSAMSK